MSKYLIGIDNGNTVTKVSLFDLNGRELCVASRSAETIQPYPGWAERSMETLWANTAQSIREVIHKSGISASDIAAVGCTGHGNGLYLLDQELKPFRNAIQSIDSRAKEILQGWEVNDVRSRVFQYAPQVFYPAQTVTLLAWLKHHERANYDRIGAVLLCKDYINACLTGELVSDYTDMSAANLIDTFNGCYSSELINLLGIPEIESALPRLAKSFEVIGCVTPSAAQATGLAVDTPIVGGMIDIDASAIGAGVSQPGQACILIGTWSINQVIVDRPIASHNLFLMSPFADPRFWIAMEGSATSAANLEWFVKHFCAEEHREAERRGISVYEVCNEMVAQIPAESSTVIFHPFLYGSNVQRNAQAGFYGVSGWHTKAHLLRAVYEGVAFGHLSHIENLRQTGATFDRARLGGGGARSAVWGQIFADLLNITVEVPASFETGTHGAALTAGVGAGVYRDFDEAVQHAVTILRTHEPDAYHHSLYQERYAQYQTLIGAMQHPWNRLSS